MKVFGIGLAAIAALACGCSTSPTTEASPTTAVNPAVLTATLACPRHFASGDSTPAASLIGHSLASANRIAKTTHREVMIVANDGKCVVVIGDLRPGRIDLWTVGNRVVKAIVEGPTSLNAPAQAKVSTA